MKTRTLLSSFVLSAAATLVACSPSPTSTPDDSSPPPPSETPGGGGNQAEPGKVVFGTSAGDDVDEGDHLHRTGTLLLSETFSDVDPVSFSAAASFSETAVGGTTASATGSCTSSTEGACSVVDCVETGADASGAAGTTKAPNAGPLKIEGLRAITLTPDEDGVYAPASETQAGQPVFGLGDKVKFSAPGADVPAFDATVAAPSLISVTSPTLGTPFQVSVYQDLVIAWDHGAFGDVDVVMSTSSQARRTTISCTFNANAGAGKVPAALLGKLQATGDDVARALTVESSSSTFVNSGGWSITARLSAGIATGSFTME